MRGSAWQCAATGPSRCRRRRPASVLRTLGIGRVVELVKLDEILPDLIVLNSKQKTTELFLLEGKNGTKIKVAEFVVPEGVKNLSSQGFFGMNLTT